MEKKPDDTEIRKKAELEKDKLREAAGTLDDPDVTRKPADPAQKDTQ